MEDHVGKSHSYHTVSLSQYEIIDDVNLDHLADVVFV